MKRMVKKVTVTRRRFIGGVVATVILPKVEGVVIGDATPINSWQNQPYPVNNGPEETIDKVIRSCDPDEDGLYRTIFEFKGGYWFWIKTIQPSFTGVIESLKGLDRWEASYKVFKMFPGCKHSYWWIRRLDCQPITEPK